MKINLKSLKNIKIDYSKRTIKLLLIVFIIGISIILFPNNKKNNRVTDNRIKIESEAKNKDDNNISYEKMLEQKMEDRFKNIEGVGKVQVLITLKSGNELVIDKDTIVNTSSTLESDSKGGNRENNNKDSNRKTVIVNDSTGEKPIIIKKVNPEINGILIIAEGGEDVTVKNNLINAAKVLLDVPVHKIQVLKMVSKGEK
jgi:stage III sporulation protein AG